MTDKQDASKPVPTAAEVARQHFRQKLEPWLALQFAAEEFLENLPDHPAHKAGVLEYPPMGRGGMAKLMAAFAADYTASLEARVGHKSLDYDALNQSYKELLERHEHSGKVQHSLLEQRDTLSASLREVRETQPEALAKQFHEAYERLAPSFGYETRKESAKPWEQVPEQNRKLMTAVCAEILAALLSRLSTDSGKAESAREEGSGKF